MNHNVLHKDLSQSDLHVCLYHALTHLPGGTDPLDLSVFGSAWNITDGITSINSVSNLTISGGTVSGSSPNATLTIASESSQWSGTSPIYYSSGSVGIGQSSPVFNLDLYDINSTGYDIGNSSTRFWNITNAGNVTAVSFITSGGTASQFLMGDGSINSNSYLGIDQTFPQFIINGTPSFTIGVNVESLTSTFVYSSTGYVISSWQQIGEYNNYPYYGGSNWNLWYNGSHWIVSNLAPNPTPIDYFISSTNVIQTGSFSGHGSFTGQSITFIGITPWEISNIGETSGLSGSIGQFTNDQGYLISQLSNDLNCGGFSVLDANNIVASGNIDLYDGGIGKGFINFYNDGTTPHMPSPDPNVSCYQHVWLNSVDYWIPMYK